MNADSKSQLAPVQERVYGLTYFAGLERNLSKSLVLIEDLGKEFRISCDVAVPVYQDAVCDNMQIRCGYY